jgi:hypothetical protein
MNAYLVECRPHFVLSAAKRYRAGCDRVNAFLVERRPHVILSAAKDLSFLAPEP